MSCQEERRLQGLPPDPACPDVKKKELPGQPVEPVRKKEPVLA